MTQLGEKQDITLEINRQILQAALVSRLPQRPDRHRRHGRCHWVVTCARPSWTHVER